MGWAMRVGQGWRLSCGCDVLVTDGEGAVWKVVERGRGCVVEHFGEVVPGAVEAPSSAPWRIVSLPDGGSDAAPAGVVLPELGVGSSTNAPAADGAASRDAAWRVGLERRLRSAEERLYAEATPKLERLAVRVAELERRARLDSAGHSGRTNALELALRETQARLAAVEERLRPPTTSAVAEQRHTGEPARLRPVCTCGVAYRVGSSVAVDPTRHRRSCPVRSWMRSGGAS